MIFSRLAALLDVDVERIDTAHEPSGQPDGSLEVILDRSTHLTTLKNS